MIILYYSAIVHLCEWVIHFNVRIEKWVKYIIFNFSNFVKWVALHRFQQIHEIISDVNVSYRKISSSEAPLLLQRPLTMHDCRFLANLTNWKILAYKKNSWQYNLCMLEKEWKAKTKNGSQCVWLATMCGKIIRGRNVFILLLSSSRYVNVFCLFIIRHLYMYLLLLLPFWDIFYSIYWCNFFFFIVFSISKHSKNTGIVHLVVENATVISIFIVLSIIEKIVSSILFEWFSFSSNALRSYYFLFVLFLFLRHFLNHIDRFSVEKSE